jgi:hypothetical protein
MDQLDRAAIPLVQDDREKPWADLGVDYEKRVLARLAAKAKILTPASGQDGLSERIATNFYQGGTNAQYASQLNLKPRQSPRQLRNVPDLRLRRTYADLVRRDGTGNVPAFRVIDIKATRIATAFHKTQVAFYARMLEAILIEQKIAHQIDPVGSIWRIPDLGNAENGEWQEDDFALTPYLRLVDDFCERVLPKIAEKQVKPHIDETFFHIYFKCEQCAYLPHCSSAIDPALPAIRRDISAVPGLTHESKRSLQGSGVRSVAQLAAASGLRKMDGAGWSLTRRAETLVVRAQALGKDEVRRAPEPHTFLMPPRTDVAFYLVADHDPVDDTLVSLGYMKVENGRSTSIIEILPSADRAAEANALVKVFSKLISDLESIDQHNQKADEATAKYSHIFFYEPSEAINLQNAVKRHLDDERIRGGLLHMVRLFPPEELVPEPEFRGMHHLPATALRSVVEQLYALPVCVSYDLRQVSNALFRAGRISQAYSPDPAFKREFSSLLSIEVSRGLREGRQTAPTAKAVEKDVRSRLEATRAIAEWLQTENQKATHAGDSPLLRLAKKPFRLQATFNPLDIGDLDVLRALELLENRSGLLDALVRLAQPVGVRRDAGRCASGLRLVATTKSGGAHILTFEVPQDSQDAEFNTDSFGLILTDDDPDVRLNPNAWADVTCNLLPQKAGDLSRRLRLRMRTSAYDSQTFQTMIRRAPVAGWCLDQSFVDFNLAKADGFLSFLAQGNARVSP